MNFKRAFVILNIYFIIVLSVRLGSAHLPYWLNQEDYTPVTGVIERAYKTGGDRSTMSKHKVYVSYAENDNAEITHLSAAQVRGDKKGDKITFYINSAGKTYRKALTRNDSIFLTASLLAYITCLAILIKSYK